MWRPKTQIGKTAVGGAISWTRPAEPLGSSEVTAETFVADEVLNEFVDDIYFTTDDIPCIPAAFALYSRGIKDQLVAEYLEDRGE